jgi:hypothetical protein
MDAIDPKILSLIITVGGAVVWALIKKQNTDQERQIALLFVKHDEDAKALQELRIQIAEGHYKKTELDVKFDRLEFAFKAGFDQLGMKFDKLSDVLVRHIEKEDAER